MSAEVDDLKEELRRLRIAFDCEQELSEMRRVEWVTHEKRLEALRAMPEMANVIKMLRSELDDANRLPGYNARAAALRAAIEVLGGTV